MVSTKIEWVKNPQGTPGETWNPVTGCSKVSAGCANCYAKRFSRRLAGRCGYPEDDPFRVTLHPEKLEEPLRWKKPRRIFVNSMSDLFHDDIPEAFIDRVLEVIAACPQHTFIVLTKRPQNLQQKLYSVTPEVPVRELGGGDYLPNLWLGVSVENQKTADGRIPRLLQIPAAIRFVSVEPMLGPVDLTRIGGDQFGWGRIDAVGGLYYERAEAMEHGCEWQTLSWAKIDWVICGGESGPGARPCHIDWIRSLRDQSQETGTPFFFKGWGEWVPGEATSWLYDRPLWCKYQNGSSSFNRVGSHEWDGRHVSLKVGKKAAGRLLDGQEWEQIPERSRQNEVDRG